MLEQLKRNQNLTKADIVADLRIHTKEFMTYKEAIEAAQENNLKAIGITNAFIGTGDRIAYQTEIKSLFDASERYARFIGANQTRVINGAEIYIGHKYIDLDNIKDLQVKVAVLDERFWGVSRQDIESLKREIKNLIDRGYVNIIASPEKKIGLLNNGKYQEGLTPAIKEYYQWLVEYCMKHKILLEVCEETFWKDDGGDFERLVYWAELARDNGNPIVVNSNAHVHNEVGNLERAIEFLNWIEYPKKLIANTSSKVIGYLFPNKYEIMEQSRIQLEAQNEEIQKQERAEIVKANNIMKELK